MKFVYLVCLERPIRANAKGHGRSHYVGATDNLLKRFNEHRKGRGCKFLAQAVREGVNFEITRIWVCAAPQVWELERSIKAQKNHGRMCPVCRART